MEQLDRSFSVSSRDGHGPPVAGQPTPGRESSEIRWPPAAVLSGRRPPNYLAARRAGQCASFRTNDFQTRHELAGFWNGKSRKLITTP
jgi:hypothetical protein